MRLRVLKWIYKTTVRPILRSALPKITMREINEIVVHCSATMPHMDVGVAEIRQWHKDKGWSDVGYHYIIRRTGVIEEGRDHNTQGAHVKGRNRDTLGICMIGGIDADGGEDANFTYAQYTSLMGLIQDLKQQYGVQTKVSGHRDYSTKACPCFDISCLLEYT